MARWGCENGDFAWEVLQKWQDGVATMEISRGRSSKNGKMTLSLGLLGQLGPSWAHLGPILGHLGSILGHLGGHIWPS